MKRLSLNKCHSVEHPHRDKRHTLASPSPEISTGPENAVLFKGVAIFDYYLIPKLRSIWNKCKGTVEKIVDILGFFIWFLF